MEHKEEDKENSRARLRKNFNPRYFLFCTISRIGIKFSLHKRSRRKQSNTIVTAS